MALEQVERRAVAEEIGFVVEQRFDDHLRQARLLAHDEDGDQLVERADRAFAQQRRKRGLDPPAAAHRQLLAGARLEQTGEDAAGTVAYLHARCSSVRAAIRRAILSGGSTAQARPASSTARGMPHTAQLASSWAMTEPPQATSRDRAFDAVAAHAGQHDAERAGAVDGADRREHRIDRRHAAAARCGHGVRRTTAPSLPGSSVR